MNPPETATCATRRLETQLGDFGIPGKFADKITGYHTVVNYNKGSMVFVQGSPARRDVLGHRRAGQGLLSAARWNPHPGQARWAGGSCWSR